jgi:hypothetical protein
VLLITLFMLLASLFVALPTAAVELYQLVGESGSEFNNPPPLFSVRYVVGVRFWLGIGV